MKLMSPLILLLLVAALPAHASYVARTAKPPVAPEGSFDPGECGQRCSFTTAAEVLSYYATYMRTSVQFTDPVEQQKVKVAFQACLQGSGDCTAKDRELLLQRAAAANMFRNVRRMILENNTNARNMESLNKAQLEAKGSKDPFLISPGLQARMNADLQRRGMEPLHPSEWNLAARKPFKIDEKKLDLRVDQGTLLDGGFSREYEFVLNNYVRPTTGQDLHLTSAYQSNAAAGFSRVATGKTGTSLEQSHRTNLDASNRGSVVEVDSIRHHEDLTTQSHANMERARQEFQNKVKTRELRQKFDPKSGRYIVDVESTGMNSLQQLQGGPEELASVDGLVKKSLTNPLGAHEARMVAYRKAAERVNQAVDTAISEKAKASPGSAVTYSIDINDFDKFIDEVWPSQAQKR